jgi:hypothetical protein
MLQMRNYICRTSVDDCKMKNRNEYVCIGCRHKTWSTFIDSRSQDPIDIPNMNDDPGNARATLEIKVPKDNTEGIYTSPKEKALHGRATHPPDAIVDEDTNWDQAY